MKTGSEVTRKSFLTIAATAIASGLLAPGGATLAKACESTMGLGHVLFDCPFTWDENDILEPPQTFGERASLRCLVSEWGSM